MSTHKQGSGEVAGSNSLLMLTARTDKHRVDNGEVEGAAAASAATRPAALIHQQHPHSFAPRTIRTEVSTFRLCLSIDEDFVSI